MSSSISTRHSKSHLQDRTTNNSNHSVSRPPPLLLSNESPILTISRSSLNRLNETIKAKGGGTGNKAAHPSLFRANIILAESPLLPPGQEQPYAEDDWAGMSIISSSSDTHTSNAPGEVRDGRGTGGVNFHFLGGCKRCQMVCIDQLSGEKNPEPFVTLAKTRRREGGRVLFGVHTALAEERQTFCSERVEEQGGVVKAIRVGDSVRTW